MLEWLALSAHSKKVLGLNLVANWNISLYLQGFPSGTPVSTQGHTS